MKRSIILLLASCIALVGCDQKKDTSNKSETHAEDAAQQNPWVPVESTEENCDTIVSITTNAAEDVGKDLGFNYNLIEIEGGRWDYPSQCTVNIKTPVGIFNCSFQSIVTDDGGKTTTVTSYLNHSCSKLEN